MASSPEMSLPQPLHLPAGAARRTSLLSLPIPPCSPCIHGARLLASPAHAPRPLTAPAQDRARPALCVSGPSLPRPGLPWRAQPLLPQSRPPCKLQLPARPARAPLCAAVAPAPFASLARSLGLLSVESPWSSCASLVPASIRTAPCPEFLHGRASLLPWLLAQSLLSPPSTLSPQLAFLQPRHARAPAALLSLPSSSARIVPAPRVLVFSLTLLGQHPADLLVP
ncbi:uncharacterized protein [Zea mays]|uniref:Uncharacterized protein n=1 Tax=Zea mays TaxID=4577 RepID=C0PFA6_MAIZE|nr:uncharacterized protein LOC118472127 [Zea mays]ACN33872.1 unknown [Zea mays]|eukprot:NP_001169480.1 uncharacterized protein LOC100383353 [Zea mays]